MRYLTLVKKILLLLLIPIFRIFNIFDFKKNKTPAIIIFYSGKLGDLICTTSVFKSVKQSRKDCKLVLINRGAFINVLDNNPYIDYKIIFKSDKELQRPSWLIKNWFYLMKFNIQYYFNLTGSYEGAILGVYVKTKNKMNFSTKYDSISQNLINLFYNKKIFNYDKLLKEFYFEMLESASIKVIDKKNQIFFNRPVPAEVENFFRENNLSNNDVVIGILASSGKDFKQWSEKYWVELINKLIDRYQAKVIFFGTQSETKKINDIKNEINKKTYCVIQSLLNVLPYYLKKCNLFISVDSGPLYMADALNVPVVNIFGPCNEINQRPENKYKLVTNKQTCRPLLITPTPVIYYNQKNIQEIKQCFNTIMPSDVFKACEEFLNLYYD